MATLKKKKGGGRNGPLIPKDYFQAKKLLRKFIALAKENGVYALDTETSGLKWFKDALYMISLYTKGMELVIPLAWEGSPVLVDQLRTFMRPLALLKNVTCFFWNAKFDKHFLKNYGVTIRESVDACVGGMLIDNRQPRKLKKRAKEVKVDMVDFKDLFDLKRGKTLLDYPMEDVAKYAGLDARATYLLGMDFFGGGFHTPEFSVGDDVQLTRLYQKVEHQITTVLFEMERNGIKIDVRRLKEYRDKELMPALKAAEAAIMEEAGCVFNVRSHIQVKRVFAARGIKLESTEEKFLKVIGDKLSQKILKYRELEKIRSTYVDGLMAVLDRHGCVHTSFNQNGTETGRFSSSDPNLQNIPRAGIIRSCFVARSGKLLVVKDFGQLELRVAAHVSKDRVMMKEFHDGLDIHTMSAATILNKLAEEITKEERQMGKSTTSFGVLFGMSAFSLARELKISEDEAEMFIINYFHKYRLLDRFIKRVKSSALRVGYVQTFLGRIRYIDNLKSKEKGTLNYGLREAVNTVIQGGAADLVKLAMIHCFFNKKIRALGAKLLLQVHDELVWEVPAENAEELSKILDYEMANFPVAKKLRVPLTVDGGVGRTWAEAKEAG